MKTITIKLSVLLVYVFTFVSCGQAQDAEKLSSNEVSAEEIKIGKSFTTAFYDALSKDSTYVFTRDNATEMMISTFSPEMQKNTYQQFKTQLGEYESSEYVEAWKVASTPGYKILRYKADFTKSNSKVEVRVIVDQSNKIAGFFVKPWSDVLM